MSYGMEEGKGPGCLAPSRQTATLC